MKVNMKVPENNCSSDNESDREVSNFLFSEDSWDEWLRRERSLVVSDLRSENKGSRFESGC